MGKPTFAIGTLILISGFVIYQLGFLAFHQSLLNPLAAIFPEGSLDLIGMALELGGGTLGIVGLLTCISTAISTQHKETLREITRLRETHPEEITIPTRRCKFCGNEIHEQTIFCPVCNRSQR